MSDHQVEPTGATGIIGEILGEPPTTNKWETLNLGCGKDLLENAVNVDRKTMENGKVDVICDALHLPFKGVFRYVIASHIIEHFRSQPAIRDSIYSSMQPDGILDVVVPNFLSVDAYGSEHERIYSIQCFCPWMWNASKVKVTVSSHQCKTPFGVQGMQWIYARIWRT